MISEEKQLALLGKQIAKVRKSNGFTQQELANTIDMHITSIGLIESGKRYPKLNTLYKIATALRVDVADFFEHTKRR